MIKIKFITFFGLVLGVMGSRSREEKTRSVKFDVLDIFIIAGLIVLAAAGVFYSLLNK